MVEIEGFNNFALEYDKWFENHETEYALELKAISEFLPKEGNGIEIGAGTGRFTHPLRISLGIEPSDAMCRLACSRGVNVVAGTAESLPLKSNMYDFALLVTTVCFLEEPEIAFKEVHRILKQEGFIIVGLIDKNSRLGQLYEENKNDSKFYKNARFHSVVEVHEKLEKAGFSMTECVQAVFPGDITESIESGVMQGYGEGSFVVLRAMKCEV
jgi:ubiquinone/menaquinone biosynthesis C-methylase UbiE